MYAWTMLTPSYVTSGPVKNYPRVNAISGALLQRIKSLFVITLEESVFYKHFSSSSERNLLPDELHAGMLPGCFLSWIFLKKGIRIVFYRFQTSMLDMFLPWYVISLAVNTSTTKSGFSGVLKYCSNIGFQYFFLVATSSWILPFALIST